MDEVCELCGRRAPCEQRQEREAASPGVSSDRVLAAVRLSEGS